MARHSDRDDPSIEVPGARGELARAPQSSGQIANIQALRCFAALVVVFHHLQMRLNDAFGTPFLGFAGVAGVDLFFVISGFIMFHTTRDGSRTAGDFWLDRAIRIVPLYWIATGLVVLLFAAGWPSYQVKDISGTDVVASFLFIPEVRHDGWNEPLLDVGWTLEFEVYFYLLFGLLLFLRSQALALAILTGVFAALAVARAVVPDLPFAIEYYGRAITLEFAAGGAVALLWQSRRVRALSPRRASQLGAALLILGVAALLVVGWRAGWRMGEQFELRLLLLGLPSAAVVAGALLLEQAGRSWRSKLVLLLGAASYAIYLFHQFVVGALIAGSKAGFGTADAVAGLALVGIGVAACAMVGVAIHLWIEKPMTRWLKRRLRPARARESVPA